MDSLGEVGKKMRSAIKAKLVELGNASPTGYIDDELPDYVMIMVANKRSKQQMMTDLNLFLGSNTEIFVNWLHQVLQKLQEVTLPTNLTTKAKKKINETGNKKDKKKDKKKTKPSITDVIAVELMEKAKKTIDPKLKCEKKEKTPSPSPEPPKVSSPEKPTLNKSNKSDDLNFQTISEINKQQNSSNVLLRKEIAQLGHVENEIGIRKRKLITLNNFERKEKSVENDVEMIETDNNVAQQKSSIKSRLGRPNDKSANIISLSAIRKSETEFLKKIVVKHKEDNERKVDDYRSTRNRNDSNSRNRRDNRRSRDPSASHDRHRNRERVRRRSRSRSAIKPHYDNKIRPSIRQRIGDRVTITSTIKNSPETDGNFKVKQRPALSSTITAHAGKSLLLRAISDAQRSTQASAESKKKQQQQRENIVVKVKNERKIHQNDEEYIPESISGHSESEAEYHASFKSQENNDDDTDVIYLNNNDFVDLDDDMDVDNNEKASPKVYLKVSAKDKSKSPTPPQVIKRKIPLKERIGQRGAENRGKADEARPRKRSIQADEMDVVEESESQRAYNKVKKARVSPIRFDLTDDECDDKSRGSSAERSEKKVSPMKNDDQNGEEQSKRIKLEASRSFDHVPALLSSIAVPAPEAAKPAIAKSKERCKYYPNCSNTGCTFYHPTMSCKIFPNCKFGDSCAYVHPRCKFDLTCHRVDCNFSHTPILASSTPIIASSVVPAQNYKSITITPNMTVCKFFPNCTNTNCVYQHPKVCKFGKSCANKFECNFYHFETASKNKFRWVSSST